MSPAGALRALRDRTPQAKDALDKSMKTHRVVVSRAPAWHKFNVVGQRPRLVEGDAIRINTFISEGLGADYDGDTMSVHLPSTPEAQKEVHEKLMPDKMVWSVKDRGQTLANPKHEQILGLNLQGGQRRQFRDRAEVIKALEAGEISPADEVDFTQ
jgi:DNA-directed RNA polymerase subunit beta'